MINSNIAFHIQAAAGPHMHPSCDRMPAHLTAPGSILKDAFHFLALPAPLCCSYCVGVKVRRSRGSTAQLLQLHMTFISDSRNVPLMPLQIMGICSKTGRQAQRQQHEPGDRVWQ